MCPLLTKEYHNTQWILLTIKMANNVIGAFTIIKNSVIVFFEIYPRTGLVTCWLANLVIIYRNSSSFMLMALMLLLWLLLLLLFKMSLLFPLSLPQNHCETCVQGLWCWARVQRFWGLVQRFAFGITLWSWCHRKSLSWIRRRPKNKNRFFN